VVYLSALPGRRADREHLLKLPSGDRKPMRQPPGRLPLFDRRPHPLCSDGL